MEHPIVGIDNVKQKRKSEAPIKDEEAKEVDKKIR